MSDTKETTLLIKEDEEVMMDLRDGDEGVFTYTNKKGWEVTIKIPAK